MKVRYYFHQSGHVDIEADSMDEAEEIFCEMDLTDEMHGIEIDDIVVDGLST